MYKHSYDVLIDIKIVRIQQKSVQIYLSHKIIYKVNNKIKYVFEYCLMLIQCKYKY